MVFTYKGMKEFRSEVSNQSWDELCYSYEGMRHTGDLYLALKQFMGHDRFYLNLFSHYPEARHFFYTVVAHGEEIGFLSMHPRSGNTYSGNFDINLSVAKGTHFKAYSTPDCDICVYHHEKEEIEQFENSLDLDLLSLEEAVPYETKTNAFDNRNLYERIANFYMIDRGDDAVLVGLLANGEVMEVMTLSYEESVELREEQIIGAPVSAVISNIMMQKEGRS